MSSEPTARQPLTRDSAETVAANTQLVLKFLEHAFANQVESVLAMLTADATWWVSGNPERLKVAGLKLGTLITLGKRFKPL